MNSNYSWQKHHTNERLQARLNEAEIHRSLKRNNKKSEHPSYSLERIVLFPLTRVAALMKRLMSHDRSSKTETIHTA